MATNRRLERKLRRIKMLLVDVDGVLTDGGLYYSAGGVEMKRFNAQDGYGVVHAHEHGLMIGIISGRSTPIVDARAKDLKVDELFDLPLLRVAGFAAAPNNARREVKRVVDYVAKARGGEGAVREIIDLILSCKKTERPGQS